MKSFISFGLVVALGLAVVSDAKAQCRPSGAFYSYWIAPEWTSGGHGAGTVVVQPTVAQTPISSDRVVYSSAQAPVQESIAAPNVVAPMPVYTTPMRSYRPTMRGRSITDQMEAGRRSIKGF